MVDRNAADGDPAARVVVAHREPAQRPALQAERLDHRLRRDVFLHHAEQRGFIELLLVIRLHRLRRQDPRADQRDREYQQRHRGELPVQEQHQDDAGDQFEERQRRAVGKALDRAFEGRQIDGEARQDLAALGAREIGRRQILDVLEQPHAHVRNQRGRELGVPSLVPDRDDRGEDSRHRQHRENLDQRLEIFFAERIVDQEFQAQRHDDVEQRLDQDAEADECQDLLVVLQERFDERIDRRQRAGGFLRGKDDEVLVVLVVFEIKFVVIISSSSSSARRRRGRLAADHAIRSAGAHAQASSSGSRRSGIIRGSGGQIIRRWRLGRHETNRCCTAGMTAKSTGGLESPRTKPTRSERNRQSITLPRYRHEAVRAAIDVRPTQSSAATLSKNE